MGGQEIHPWTDWQGSRKWEKARPLKSMLMQPLQLLSRLRVVGSRVRAALRSLAQDHSEFLEVKAAELG